MSDNSGSIQVFLRLRPTKKSSGLFECDTQQNTVDFDIPVDVANTYINNTRSKYKFKFNGLVGMEATQEDVFDHIAKPVVDSSLAGFNATIFAYGQTGSGKTFTITGGAERYVDRGIIPRAISHVFNEVKKRSDSQYTVHISYLEIYNDCGYDLLDPRHDTKSLEDLQKVSMMDDEEGNCHLRNLSLHVANSEEDALNLLFLGDTNRAISETPMNLASSRSHCIFTISLEGRKAGADVITRSKLNLVDLAGSERVHKTSASGQILREAGYINSSLHFLEMVIVALHEKSTKGRTHIPYRNSMMTNVLRDSLGGNCKTAMIATVSAEKAQTEETLSTCRFAQRVAKVKNDARLNEELDPTLVIRRLKAQVAALQEEIAFLKGETGEGGDVSAEMEEQVQGQIEAFTADPSPDATLPLTGSFSKIKCAFRVFKTLLLGARAGGGGGAGGAGVESAGQSAAAGQRDCHPRGHGQIGQDDSRTGGGGLRKAETAAGAAAAAEVEAEAAFNGGGGGFVHWCTGGPSAGESATGGGRSGGGGATYRRTQRGIGDPCAAGGPKPGV